MAITIFISPTDLKVKTQIDGNIDTDKITYLIELAQDQHIQNLLGTKLYERLQKGVTDGDLNVNEINLIENFIINTLIHYVAVDYMKIGAYTVSNGGIFKRTPNETASISGKEISDLAQRERDTAQFYATRLVKFLCKNSALFPEFTTNNNEDIKPASKVRYTGGWYL